MKNGYLNFAVSSTSPVWGGRCCLRCFWHVDVDKNYQSKRNATQEYYILVRNISGSGRIFLKNNQELTINNSEILLLQNTMIKSYQTLENSWHFFWFEFECNEKILPINKILLTPHNQLWEFSFFEQLRMLLTQPNTLGSQAASELFGGYLLAIATNKTLIVQPDTRITLAIEYISRTLPNIPTVKELAQFSNLCERRFRQLFIQETGVSPKKYCDDLRLQLAWNILPSGNQSIKEISTLLNFSSPFAFSNAFFARYGIRPSDRASKASLL